MNFGNQIVEQVNSYGDIVMGRDFSHSPSKLLELVKIGFPNIELCDNNLIYGVYKGKSFTLKLKNVTYLGNPHPVYKKRIQISNDLQEFYKKSTEMGAQPILLGIYTHKDNLIYVDFRIDDFVGNKAHNSSAHVYTDDISSATIDGYFQKIDSRNNQITVFRPNMVSVYLDNLLFTEQEINEMRCDNAIAWQIADDEQFELFEEEEQVTNETSSVAIVHAQTEMVRQLEMFGEIESANTVVMAGNLLEQSSTAGIQETIEHVTTLPTNGSITTDIISRFKLKVETYLNIFFGELEREWNGISCYTKMINDDYRNKFQPEWAGFFLEFEFEKFIHRNNIENFVKYAQDKTVNGIDLDLYFSDIGAYGDLKAHDENSGIQGNDAATVFTVLGSTSIYNHIYYIVCEHSTVKDRYCNFEVTKFWNRAKYAAQIRSKKKISKPYNEMSYYKRMKNRVTLKRWFLLDINNDNKKHLSNFKQGVNSDGKPRKPKISIDRDKLRYFTIAEYKID